MPKSIVVKTRRNVKRNLIGQRFGRLTVTEEGPNAVQPCGKHYRRWYCSCDCGNTTLVWQSGLIRGISQSCGCIQRELLSKRNTTHGMANTRLYGVWAGMINRCTNPKSDHFPAYGSRNITVTPRWMQFENFLSDMGPTYKQGLTIERNDVNGNYEPSNCRWIPMSQQFANIRKNINITVNGEIHYLAEWARILNVKREMIKSRINRGWSPEQAVTLPPGSRRPQPECPVSPNHSST